LNSQRETYDAIVDDIRNRSDYEKRLTNYEQQRFCKNVRSAPYPGATRMVWPLIDTIVEKLKPYYYQQIFAVELLASFFSKRNQPAGFSQATAQWFDFWVRVKSNFKYSAGLVIDSMLNLGKGIVKTFWSEQRHNVRFDFVHPYYLIVPQWTEELQDADHVTQVIQMSKERYLRIAAERGMPTDEALVRQMSGTPQDALGSKDRAQAQATRQGITWSEQPDIIVLWDIYERTDSGEIQVRTMCPLLPDEVIREVFRLPFGRHRTYPFTSFDRELIDKSFHSSRGAASILSVWQNYLSRLINGKSDYIDFCNRPLLSTADQLINTSNIRFEPGQIIASPLTAVQFPEPPISFEAEVAQIRGIAEQRMAMPDFGLASPSAPSGVNRTATELEQQGSVLGGAMEMATRIFRESLTEVYRQAWTILLEYKKQDLEFFYRGQYFNLSPNAVHDQYELEPNGSADGYSREREIMKMLNIRQVMAGAPWIKLADVDRRILELTNPALVRELYTPPADVQGDQIEEQADEISNILVAGYTPQISATDNHLIHWKAIQAFYQHTLQSGQNLRPDSDLAIRAHARAHAEALQKSDPDSFAQIKAEVAAFEQASQALAQQIAAQSQQPGELMPGGPGIGAPPVAMAMPAAMRAPPRLAAVPPAIAAGLGGPPPVMPGPNGGAQP
jgi:hypothetical protein